MRTFKVWKTSWVVFVFVVFLTGCGQQQAHSPALPTVISTSPANGDASVLLNTVVSAHFSSAMAASTINTTTFTLTGPGAVPVVGTVSYTGTTATFTPTVSLAANSVYTGTVTTGAQDQAGGNLAANFVWSFTTGAPTVIVVVPANAATAVPVNSLVVATFSEGMDALTLNGATFTVTGPGATPVAGAVTAAGNTATFTPTAVLASNTPYTVTITTGAKDPAGVALATNFVSTFTTAPAPTVVSTVPSNGATAIALNRTVTATFSRAMNAATVNGTTFTVTGPGSTPVPGVVTSAGTLATFTPTAVLANSTLYTATITTGAKDTTGAALAANSVWTFTTVPPTVISTIPANAATAVPVSTLVSATFSGPMDPPTLNAATFTLTGPGATPVAGAVTYSGNTAIFTPSALLAESTAYAATITTGAKDPIGNPLAAAHLWTFTTAPATTVTSTVPANGTINVPLNQKIAATFSAPMTGSTITAPGTFTVAVAGVGGAAVPGTVTYDAASRTATFAPGAALAASTQFTAMVTSAAQSSLGRPLAANYAWNFTSGVAANASVPRVISAIPDSAAVGVPLNQRIAATFSAPMDPATITAPGTFTVAVAGIGGVAVPGTVSYAGRTAVFTPAANLDPSTEYTATLTNAAEDLTGIAMAADFAENFTTGVTANVAAPAITLTSPADTDVNVAIDKTISATFDAAMDPTTITSATFTVAEVGGPAVDGIVSYDPASQIATFVPSAPLAANTQYIASLSSLVTDLSGNALAPGAVPTPWSFTTGATAGAGQAMINLSSAGTFAVMATASISSTGPTVINGDVGLQPGTSQGIPPAQVNGTIHINDPMVTQAQADLLAAYNDAVSRSTNAQTLPGNMGGLTFAPGLYVNSTSVLLSGAGANNIVTLDAQGDPSAVFIFKMGSTLTTAPGSQVVLAGGAKAGNIFWQVGTSATIDTTTIFKGNVLAATTITLNTGADVEGRMFAGAAGGAGSATVSASTVSVPAP